MKPLNAIYWFNSLSVLAWSLIGIFIPIYFLTIGYSLGNILLFYILDSCTVFISSVCAAFISTRIGLKRTLLIYLPFLAAFVVMLYFVGELAIPLWLIAVVAGIQTAFYFIPINIMFAHYTSEQQTGFNVGKMSAYSQAASFAAPLIGGVLAATGGFPSLVAFSGLIFSLESIFLFFITDATYEIEFSVRRMLFFLKKYARFAAVQVFQFFQQTLESIIWPVFIFLSFGSIISIGFVGALMGAGSFFFMLFIGRRADVQNKKTLFKIGAVVMAAVWIGRYLFRTEIASYVLTVFAGFFAILISIPFNALAFNLSKNDNTAEFMIFREFTLLISRLLAFGLAFFLVGHLDYTFVAAAISNAFFFLL